MSTFTHAYGPAAMLEAVADEVRNIEEPDTGDMAVHTISLVLNGQHGDFDLTVEATDMDVMEEHKWTGIAHRGGGVSEFEEVDL